MDEWRAWNGLFLGIEESLGVVAGGGSLAAEHAGEFIHAVFMGEQADVGGGAVVAELFIREEMGMSSGGDGSEVGDAEDLSLEGDLTHFFADGMGGFAADIGVDLIEDQDEDIILSGEDGFEGEHDAGEFAGGSDGTEGFGRFAGVGAEEEFGGIESGWGNGIWKGGSEVGLESDMELALFEAEVSELAGDGFAEFWD